MIKIRFYDDLCGDASNYAVKFVSEFAKASDYIWYLKYKGYENGTKDSIDFLFELVDFFEIMDRY